MFSTCLHIIFKLRVFFIAIKSNAKINFHLAAMLLFYILHIYYLTKFAYYSKVHYHMLLLYIK